MGWSIDFNIPALVMTSVVYCGKTHTERILIGNEREYFFTL